jgi:hypothetical protein
MGFEIADLRGVGSDYMGQMVVYLAAGDNPITEEEWATYTPDPGFILNTPRGPKFDVLNVLGSPYQPSGVFTYFTDSQGFTWQSVAAVENRIYPFDASDYTGYTPPLTNSAQAGYVVLTPLPGTIQYNSNDKNHENVYYAEDDHGVPQFQYFVTDPWGNVYILKSVNQANDTPEEVAAAVEAAVLPEGWSKSSGYLDKDTTYLPVWSGDVAHANEFRDSADSAWMQIKWGKSGITLATKIGDGLEIWGGNSNDLVKGNGEDNVVHGGGGDDEVRGKKGADTLTGDDGDDLLKGGRGDDALLGGSGRDDLDGGRGKDIFAFAELRAGKDEILDFVRGKDLIDLSAIDARAPTEDDDAFDFVGRQPFSAEAGELRYQVKTGGALVKGDTDGDGRADFVIRVAEIYRLEEADFIV